MKLEVQMTERDKKLLIFLAVFVIVVGIGYWGVKPIIQDIFKINDEIESQEALSVINDMKVAELPMLEKDNEDFEEEILEARKQFYKMMTPDEVDKMMTGIVLSYGLYSYDLTINISEITQDDGAYKYSAKYAEDQARLAEAVAEAEIEAEKEKSKSKTDEYDELFDSEETVYIDEEELTGIYKASVSMRLGGEREDLQKLIDDYSDSNKAFKIEKYSFANNVEMIYNETTGEYEMLTDDSLIIEMSFYMCEE